MRLPGYLSHPFRPLCPSGASLIPHVDADSKDSDVSTVRAYLQPERMRVDLTRKS